MVPRGPLSFDGDLSAVARAGELTRHKGFGPATAEVVREVVENGVSTLHEELREKTPAGLFELLGIPGLGVKRIRTLHEKLGIDSLDALERAARHGEIAKLQGFGEKTQEKLLEGVQFRRGVRRPRLPEAWAAARAAAELLGAVDGVTRVEVAGELRRWVETVDRVELVVEVEEPARVIEAFLAQPGVTEAEVNGGAGGDGDAGAALREPTAQVVLANGLTMRLHCAAPDEFAATLVHTTGSAEHWEALHRRADAVDVRLGERGVWKDGGQVVGGSEEALYQALGLAYIAPELREGAGEVEAAAEGRLPELVRLEDLEGCFHCHTTYSDGKASVREMAEAALARGWRYLGLADHSRAAAYAGGLDVDAIARQHEEIDEWNAERGSELWLFKGIEADILTNGRLDYADEDEDVLARFDYVVASVHSSFGLSQAEQTARVLKALENPHLTFLGHPTGRLLLSREGYAIDMDAVIEAAAERGVGIEINANPWRLDMDWRLWRRAAELGVRAAINPDAHSVDGLDDVRYGVAVARKGWLTPAEVVNSWSFEEVKKFFAEDWRR